MTYELIETGIWSVLPPLVAITLALVTKEVYSSLFFGLVSGVAIYSIAGGKTAVDAVVAMFDMMCSKIAENAYMILFLALLWAVVMLVSKSGGSEAYGRWAEKRLKSKRGASFAAFFLGILIFIDDGFNCLTVGTVMRPVFDRARISREKLAYILDATAAPICIIAPVSSWAVAVAANIDKNNGFSVFLSTIPYNFYAFLTVAALVFICWSGKDFGPMKKAEETARFAAFEENEGKETPSPKGRVFDLVLPVLALIVCAILGMGYVGGLFRGVPFSKAIGENPTAGFALGAFAALCVAAVLYLPRKLMTPKTFVESVVKGVGSIVPPMIILVLSWSLSGVCRQMIGTGEFISDFVNTTALPLHFLPFLLFLVAAVMAFSMGTSWGTFGILIPIVTMICAADNAAPLLVPMVGATLSGSVFGDHCSPISDTTILSSTGAKCEHIRHVETQLPYAVLVASACAVGYLLIGLCVNVWVAMAISAVLLLAAFVLLCGKAEKPKN